MAWKNNQLNTIWHPKYWLCLFENEAHFVLEYSLYNHIRDKFPSLFENIILGSFKSSFQLDHEVDISLYLMESIATL